jgi:hypothetical protein
MIDLDFPATIYSHSLPPGERATALCEMLGRICTSLDRMIERVPSIDSRSCSSGEPSSTGDTPRGREEP